MRRRKEGERRRRRARRWGDLVWERIAAHNLLCDKSFASGSACQRYHCWFPSWVWDVLAIAQAWKCAITDVTDTDLSPSESSSGSCRKLHCEQNYTKQTWSEEESRTSSSRIRGRWTYRETWRRRLQIEHGTWRPRGKDEEDKENKIITGTTRTTKTTEQFRRTRQVNKPQDANAQERENKEPWQRRKKNKKKKKKKKKKGGGSSGSKSNSESNSSSDGAGSRDEEK